MLTNVIIFGTGLFYSRRKDMLPEETNIVAFIDNNIEIQGTYRENILIYNPSEVSKLNYDVIILASITTVEMRNQLLSLGVPKDKIMFWQQYVSSKTHGIIKKYEVDKEQNGKKLLLIVPFINYTGSFLVALNAALALKSKGYYVLITSPMADDQTILEVNRYGINVCLCPSLPYIEETEMKWIQEFDFVLLNTFQSMVCINRLGLRKPVLWWLHECNKSYKDILEQYEDQGDFSSSKNVTILAVSKIAKDNFLKYFQNLETSMLTFGIPDFYRGVKLPHKKIIFVIIGGISLLKNQKELINALKRISLYEKNKMELWLIGSDDRNKYREEIDDLISDNQEIKILGELSRKEIEKIFQQVDVVVCSSLEETMSITIVEGMMNHKICITNTNTGIAEFIQDNENGFIYEAGNVDDLTAKLKYVIQNFNSLDIMRKNARQTYEKYFTMEIFGDRLQEIIENKI